MVSKADSNYSQITENLLDFQTSDFQKFKNVSMDP